MAARLALLGRLANVRLGAKQGTPEIRVEILRDRAAAYGIDPRDVADAVDRGMRGERATEFVDFDRKVAVVVRYPAVVRHSRATLATLRVHDVPLRELVRVEEVLGPAEVRREDQGRVVTVYADVIQGGLDQAIAAVRDELRSLPPARDLRMEVGGENEEMRRSFRGLGVAFLLAMVLVYMVLAAQFESFVHPRVSGPLSSSSLTERRYVGLYVLAMSRARSRVTTRVSPCCALERLGAVVQTRRTVTVATLTGRASLPRPLRCRLTAQACRARGSDGRPRARSPGARRYPRRTEGSRRESRFRDR